MSSLMRVQRIVSQNVTAAIKKARNKVRRFRKPVRKYKDPRRVIARFTAAIAVNFTDWMGKTYPWVRHEDSEHAIKDNLRCEQEHDHIGMLLDFAKQAQARVTAYEHEWVSLQVEMIRSLFQDVQNAGLAGLTVLAILENTSDLLIPLLEKMGKKLGVKDFTYTRVHGKADIKHSEAFIAALIKEAQSGYTDYAMIIERASDATIKLLRRIFA